MRSFTPTCLAIISLFAAAASARETLNAADLLGTWSLDKEAYVEGQVARVTERLEQLRQERNIESDEAVEDRIAYARKQAEEQSVEFTLKADGSFSASTTFGNRGRAYAGEWVLLPEALLLYDTDVKSAGGGGERSDALNWAVVLEGDAQQLAMRAGHLGLLAGDHVVFHHVDKVQAQQVDVAQATAPQEDSPFAGTWRFDAEALADELEETSKRAYEEAKKTGRKIREEMRRDKEEQQEQEQRRKEDASTGEADDDDAPQRSLTEEERRELKRAVQDLRQGLQHTYERVRHADVTLTLRGDGAYRFHSHIPHLRGEETADERSFRGSWYAWDDHVVFVTPRDTQIDGILGAAEAPLVAMLERRGDELTHVAGIFPVLNAQPLSTLARVSTDAASEESRDE